MADISKLEQQANLLFNNVAGWESSTLQRIGKRIGKYGKMSLADVKAINNIAVVKQDMDAITKELAKVTGYNISQIEQMYGELLEEQHLANQPLYDYRGKKFVPFKDNRELQAIARTYAKTTGETMINLSKISAQNLGVVKNINGKNVFVPLQKFYTDALDKAVMQVTSGATDFHTAMRETIQTLGGSGMSVNYGSGIHKRLDTAVRQSLLWGAKQASVEYNEMIGKELGCDGIEIDWHSNPRPSHAGMQGKQYSVVGKKTINGVTYEDAYEQGIDSKDHESGLLNDYGCLHYKTPIILGISEPRYSPEELKRLNEQNAKKYTIDGKEYSGYDITQMQRRLESSVRNEKTTRDLAGASGDNALVKRCNERIKAYQTKYNEISEITGIQGDKKRMWVGKGGNPKDLEGVKIKPPIQKSATSVKGGAPTVEKVAEQPKAISSSDLKKQIDDIEKQMDEVPLDENWIAKTAELEQKRDEIRKRLEEKIKQEKIVESKKKVKAIEDEFREREYFATKGEGAYSSTDIELCDEKTAQDILHASDVVFEKYPQLKGKLAGINVRDADFPENAMASTNGFSGIVGNPKYFSKYEKISTAAQQSGETGFLAVGDVKGTVAHEFGHAVDVYLSKGGEVFAGGAEWKSISAKIQKETLSSLGLPKEAIEKGVSKYATYSSKEFFAECFSEYTLSSAPRPIAKKFGEILERELSKIK